MDWSKGYTTDLHYLSAFYQATSPVHMRNIQLLAGQRPPDISQPFRCLDLGAGSGVGLCVLAAANPQSEFVAVDYHPGHIAVGRRFARQSGLTNISFHEADLTEVSETADSEFGQFDFVICHGVYSWVAPEVRNALVRVLSRCTAPSALVFFGYNSLPGWTNAGPVQKLLIEYSNLSLARSDERIAESPKFIQTIAELGAKFLELESLPAALRPKLADLDNISADSLRYLAHEYLSEHWSPSYHIDVVRHLKEAKLSFVGSATITSLFVDMVATTEQQKLLNALPAGPFREQIKEYFAPHMYRRDIFVRGGNPISAEERSKRIRSETLALAVRPDLFKFEIDIAVGKAQLPKKPYEELVSILSEGPATIGRICDSLERIDTPLTPEEMSGMVLGSDQCVILSAPSAEPTDALRGFNLELSRFALTDLSAHNLALACATTQTGLNVSRFEFILYTAIVQCGNDSTTEILVDKIIELCHLYNERLLHENQIVNDPTLERQYMRGFVENELPSKIDFWRCIGAL